MLLFLQSTLGNWTSYVYYKINKTNRIITCNCHRYFLAVFFLLPTLNIPLVQISFQISAQSIQDFLKSKICLDVVCLQKILIVATKNSFLWRVSNRYLVGKMSGLQNSAIFYAGLLDLWTGLRRLWRPMEAGSSKAFLMMSNFRGWRILIIFWNECLPFYMQYNIFHYHGMYICLLQWTYTVLLLLFIKIKHFILWCGLCIRRVNFIFYNNNSVKHFYSRSTVSLILKIRFNASFNNVKQLANLQFINAGCCLGLTLTRLSW
jgi:hypothetical protein